MNTRFTFRLRHPPQEPHSDDVFTQEEIVLAMAISIIGFLYSSVGHAGASGYIAVMSLAGLAPDVIKPAALVLNIAVAAITSIQFFRAGHFSWALFWPFALSATPLAFLGGYLALPAELFKKLVGLVLVYSAWRFFAKTPPDDPQGAPRRGTALSTGGALGLLSGLTGTGGGIFLTPLLLFKRWANAKTAAAISALFILLNSTAGLAGHVAGANAVPSVSWLFVLCAAAGGVAGSYSGSRRFDHQIIKRMLAVVLLIAGLKLLWPQ